MSTSPAKAVDPQKEKQKEARKEERIQHLEQEDKVSPQWPWSEWSKAERTLPLLVGLTPKQLEAVLAQCRDALLAVDLHQYNTAKHTALSPHNLLCTALYWLRAYPTYHELATVFERSPGFFQRHLPEVLQCLDDGLCKDLSHPVDPTHGTRSAHTVATTVTVSIPLAPKAGDPHHARQHIRFCLGCDASHRIVSVARAEESRVLADSDITNKGEHGKREGGHEGQEEPHAKKQRTEREVAKLRTWEGEKDAVEAKHSALRDVGARVRQWKVMAEEFRADASDAASVDRIVRVVCALTNAAMED